MKKRKFRNVIAVFLLLCSIMLNMTGCFITVEATDLMEGITPREVGAPGDMKGGATAVTDFAVRLFAATNKNGENVLISPLSVLCALAMTANGADGTTLEQMENVFGMSNEELNLYLYSYINSLPQGEKYKLNVANSIWFKDDDRFTVNRDFLQTNADYFGADIYKAPFDDQTLRDINNWAKKETDGMIPNVLKKIDEAAIMYLVNALAFEAEWNKIYEKYQVSDGKFTKEDGTEQNAEFMYCSEGKYLEDGNAKGFIKYYSGYKYAFVALLPDEDVTVSDYINSLDGTKLNEMLTNAESATVKTAIPKFETEFSTEMSDILKNMGMTDAFDLYNADFSSLGSYEEQNIFINNVIHKTFIQVGEKGTKAGAVTVIEMNAGSACPPEEIKEVYLDRPFVYMLIDCENSIPFFIGTMMDINE